MSPTRHRGVRVWLHLVSLAMDGVFNVNKPPGRTSFSVVAQIRRLSGERRVGHTGTLDPDATGVLPVCVGRATRIAEYLLDTVKAYRAEIELGVTTDTYDTGGKVLRRGDVAGITEGQLEAALGEFRGHIRQTPPMFSAVKHQGRRLYELARAGVDVKRRSRAVEISRLEIVQWRTPTVTVEVECSKGTYVRSLAHDLGEALGCGGRLRGLVRLRSGPFHIEDAVSIEELEDAFGEDRAQRYLHRIDSVLSHLPAVTVDEDVALAVSNGCSLTLDVEGRGDDSGGAAAPGQRCRAYARDGSLLALLRFDLEAGQWRPEKVFRRRLIVER